MSQNSKKVIELNENGYNLFLNEEYNEAIKYFDKALKLDPNCKEAWNNKGLAFDGLGKYKKAIKCFDEAIKLDPKYKEAWNNKGNTLDNSGKVEEAIKCFEVAFDLVSEENRNDNISKDDSDLQEDLYFSLLPPKTVLDWKKEGNDFFDQGKYEEAIQCFDEVLKLESNNKEVWYNKGLSLNKLGSYEEAIKCYDEAIKLDPKFKEAWYNKGFVFDALAKSNEAIQCYEEAIKLGSTSAKKRINEIMKAKHREEASVIYAKYGTNIKIEFKSGIPKTGQAWRDEGNRFFNEGKYNEALQCFDEAIQLNFKDKLAFYNKGNTLNKLGKYNEAILCFNEVIRLDPKNKYAHYNKGNSMNVLAKYNEAIQCYDEAIKIDSKLKEAWYNKGISLSKLDRYDEAIQCLKEANKLGSKTAQEKILELTKEKLEKQILSLNNQEHKKDAYILFQCLDKEKNNTKSALDWKEEGNLRQQLETSDEAIHEKFQKVSNQTWISSAPMLLSSELNSKNSKTVSDWKQEGNSLFKKEKYNEAIQCYDKALKLNPNNKSTFYEKGLTLNKLGKYNEAIECFDEAIKLDPKYKKAWFNKGHSLYNLGKIDEAMICYKEGSNQLSTSEMEEKNEQIFEPSTFKATVYERIDSSLIPSKTSLDWKEEGNDFFVKGKYNEAIQCFDEAIKLDPKHKEVWNNKGISLNILERYNEAIQCFDEVIKLDPKYKDAWFNKGISLTNSGRYSEAIQSYTEAIKIDPKLKEAWVNKGNLLVTLGKLDEAIQCYEEAIKLGSKSAQSRINEIMKVKNTENSETLKEFQSNEVFSTSSSTSDLQTSNPKKAAYKEKVKDTSLKEKKVDEIVNEENFDESQLTYFPFMKGIEKQEQIGDGYGGVVFKGKWGNKLVALKLLNSYQLNVFIKEGAKLRDLNHSNIVKLWGIFKDHNIYLLCTEFVSGGSLDKFLKKKFAENQKLNDRELLKLAISAAKGLRYLEKKKIIHRDIAARNFLVAIEEEEIFLKISDFGLSVSLERTGKTYYRSNSSKAIPYQWSAIEILSASTPEERKYTHKSDVWSFGITLWELFNHGQVEPFEDLTWDGIVKRVKKGKRPKQGDIPENVYSIMLKCWNENPEDRPTFDQLYKDLKKLK